MIGGLDGWAGGWARWWFLGEGEKVLGGAWKTFCRFMAPWWMLICGTFWDECIFLDNFFNLIIIFYR